METPLPMSAILIVITMAYPIVKNQVVTQITHVIPILMVLAIESILIVTTMVFTT